MVIVNEKDCCGLILADSYGKSDICDSPAAYRD